MTLSGLLAICGRKPPITSGFSSQRKIMLIFNVILLLDLISYWTNRGVALNSTCHDPHVTSFLWPYSQLTRCFPDSKVHGANMGSTWVLSAPDGPMLAPRTLLSGFTSWTCHGSIVQPRHVFSAKASLYLLWDFVLNFMISIWSIVWLFHCVWSKEIWVNKQFNR